MFKRWTSFNLGRILKVILLLVKWIEVKTLNHISQSNSKNQYKTFPNKSIKLTSNPFKGRQTNRREESISTIRSICKKTPQLHQLNHVEYPFTPGHQTGSADSELCWRNHSRTVLEELVGTVYTVRRFEDFWDNNIVENIHKDIPTTSSSTVFSLQNSLPKQNMLRSIVLNRNRTQKKKQPKK